MYKQSSAAASPPRAPCRMQREPGPSYTHYQQRQCGMHGEMPVRFHFCRNRSAEQVRAERAVSGQTKDPAGAVAETKCLRSATSSCPPNCTGQHWLTGHDTRMARRRERPVGKIAHFGGYMASNRRDFLKRAALAGAGAALYQTLGKGRAWAFAQSPTSIRKFVTSLPGLGAVCQE